MNTSGEIDLTEILRMQIIERFLDWIKNELNGIHVDKFLVLSVIVDGKSENIPIIINQYRNYCGGSNKNSETISEALNNACGKYNKE